MAQIDDPAFLFFLGYWVCQDQHFAAIYFMLHQQQASVGIHHHGFARFLKLLAVMLAALRFDTYLVKDSPAAARYG